MKKILLIVIVFLYFFEINAQSHLKFGEWKAYLPFKNTVKISETKNKIFCSTNISMFSIDKEDFSINLYDKTNYLNDVEIAAHRYDSFNNQLIVIYSNGNIDIITDDGTYNIPDIKNNLSILGHKKINDLIIANQKYAYFAYDFGISQFDLETFEFGFTCFTEFNINSVLQVNDILYMGSDDGIYKYDFKSNGNPADILQWEKIFNGVCNDLVEFKNKLYFRTENDILTLPDNQNYDTIYHNDSDYQIQFLNSSENYLIIGETNPDINKSMVNFIDKTNNLIQKEGCLSYVSDVIIDETGRVWYADLWSNLKWSQNIDSECNTIYIDGPQSYECADIETMNNNIYIASGGANKINYTYAHTRSGFYIFNGENWINYHEYSLPVIAQNNLSNFLTIEPAKDGKTVYAGTFWGGLVELNTEDNSTKLWDNTNSALGVAQGDYLRTRIADMQFDSDNNLWITNFLSLKPLVVYTKEGDWFSFELRNGTNQVAEITVDNNNYKWLKVVNNGIIVYDNNNTINDYTDDRQISITKSNMENMISNNVTALKTDLDGNVWVGTDQGPIVFECTSGIFEGNCTPTRKKTVLEGIPAYVLDKVNITSIEIDGANRKWIGSTSGLYVLSSSGEDEIMHFTVDNSPLFANIITSLAYNGNTGEMIIGTSKGVLSFKTKTTEGKIRNSSAAYVFPNPVPPDYSGAIAIKGLARDANVKIVDITGSLVFETKALGGQAIWNGKDLHGNRVGSGVYIVYSTGKTSFDEPEAIALKIFFIK